MIISENINPYLLSGILSFSLFNQKIFRNIFRRQNFFQERYGDSNFFFIFISIKDVKLKLRIITKNYIVDSTIQFPTKAIFRPMVFTKTIREHRS